LKLKLKDNTVLPRLSSESDIYKDVTIEHIEGFAREGFRTLVLAYKDISQQQYNVKNNNLS
jgi:phospholipid-transporting ATPase